jgi:serine/threonine protein kinase
MWICPECRALYRAKESKCQRDGFALVPVQANLSKAKYPLLNKTVDGRYLLLAGLGQGGLGTVYLAVHQRLNQLFAIKFLDLETVGIQADAAQSAEYREDFMKEARVASLIHHDAVVRVTDFGDFEGLPYLVMDFVAGPSLLAMLGHRGRFKVDEAVNIAWSIAEALAAFHERKLIHRDLKPANVILDPRGGQLTLVDLGLVKDISGYGGKASTHPMALRGTPGYLAPEQVPSWVLSGISTTQSQSKGLVDARVDMYALGVMLYEMIAGVSPYPDGSNTQIIIYACTKDPLSLRGVEPPIDLSSKLEQLVYDTMARDPDKRPATASEFIERLKAVTGGQKPSAWPEVIMLNQRSTLQGVLPPIESKSVSNEPSLIDVFGDDSQISPLPHAGYNQDQTIEADLGSFDEPSFVSVDSNTSISDFDSRSRYHTTELRRDATEIEVRESLEQTSDYDVMPEMERPASIERGSNISAVSSHTVGNYPIQDKEKKGFRYGFYVVLLLLIAVLGMQVMEKSSLTLEGSSAQPATPNPKSGDSSAGGPVSTKPAQAAPAVDKSSAKVEKAPATPENTTEDIGQKTGQSDRSKAAPSKTSSPPEQTPENETRVQAPKSAVRIPPSASTKKQAAQARPIPAKKTPKKTAGKRNKFRSKPTVRRPGMPKSRMSLAELRKRGDDALGTRDCAGALTYYRKWLERAPQSHLNREQVRGRVEYCEKN